MIEICLKYDNMHIVGMINAFNCIHNKRISCINGMLSVARRSGGSGGGTRAAAVAAWGRRRRGDKCEVPVAGARSGGGWTPSAAFREQPLEMEETPFFLK